MLKIANQRLVIRGLYYFRSQEMTSILMDGIRLIEKMNDFILNKLEKINSPTLNLHYYYKRIEYQRCNSNLYKEDKFNYNQLMSQN
ncbi:unnamed protein product [Paramecium primaurelia]|uniref:Uncharacterized protein n=1 Tax=Paramecium primaurelia TaxID=5886 RepID=A0A8S1MFF4_PARPR|nr:unnamed protein product [Paramecium primaurelia]